ncbi:SigE family RNA polymerase sigma factor [Cryptosporangium aurantiacum]|uniref:RNA polymerase sigma-70 factor, sigma-E family n=1 Tax=Cryptosporangium aurantiacum TaxID=134849 RepID=A0A1M7N4Z4_9ACTN|nr:SigE family RNA polymerase sigma factor [Cryptosporangium aurantiacum]SHM98565.1 RNA polymerase sigma-70 factor, sigma-E family [Cryptosporangium aurantiacum]
MDDEYHEYVRSALPALRRLAYVLCQDGHRADDLVQGALVKLYLHWGKARAATNRDAYARTVLVRVFLGEKRAGWARRVVLVDRLPDVASTGPDPAATLALRAALATLPAKQRAALVLRYYADLSVDETAEALGCPANTVKSHTARGIAALRRVLPDETHPADTRSGR